MNKLMKSVILAFSNIFWNISLLSRPTSSHSEWFSPDIHDLCQAYSPARCTSTSSELVRYVVDPSLCIHPRTAKSLFIRDIILAAENILMVYASQVSAHISTLSLAITSCAERSHMRGNPFGPVLLIGLNRCIAPPHCAYTCSHSRAIYCTKFPGASLCLAPYSSDA